MEPITLILLLLALVITLVGVAILRLHDAAASRTKPKRSVENAPAKPRHGVLLDLNTQG